MMSKVKNYFEDYAVAQKACNEFNKKHWLGTLVFTAVIYVITLGGLVAANKIKDKIEDRKAKKLAKKNLNKK